MPEPLVPPTSQADVNAWLQFLQQALHNNTISAPYGTPGGELHHALINIYRLLKDSQVRSCYDEAICLVFESRVGSLGSEMDTLTLLQVIAYARPPNAKQMVRRAVVGEILRGQKSSGYDLHSFALAVAGQFSVDDELLDYIERSVRKTNDLRYLITCFRLRSLADSQAALEMLPRLVGTARTPSELQLIAREIKGYVAVAGFRPLAIWYLKNRRIAGALGQEFNEFEVVLLRDVTGAAIDADSEGDPFRPVVVALIMADARELTPIEYISLATALAKAERSEVEGILEFIWNEQRARGWILSVLGPDDYQKVEQRPAESIALVSRVGLRYLAMSAAPTASATLLTLAQGIAMADRFDRDELMESHEE